MFTKVMKNIQLRNPYTPSTCAQHSKEVRTKKYTKTWVV